MNFPIKKFINKLMDKNWKALPKPIHGTEPS